MKALIFHADLNRFALVIDIRYCSMIKVVSTACLGNQVAAAIRVTRKFETEVDEGRFCQNSYLLN